MATTLTYSSDLSLPAIIERFSEWFIFLHQQKGLYMYRVYLYIYKCRYFE